MPGQVTECDTVASALSCVLQLLGDVLWIAGPVAVDLQCEHLHVDAFNAAINGHEGSNDRREELGILRVLNVAGIGVYREVTAADVKTQIDIVLLLAADDQGVRYPHNRDGVVDLD